MRKVHNEYLDHRFELVDRPERVVCLVSSATEAMSWMGLLDRVVGVSEYCGRYAEVGHLPVVGQYMVADVNHVQDLDPDLVLLTTGIQRKISQKLAHAGLPVYNLALPSSFEGVLENIRLLGGLLNALPEANRLIAEMRDGGQRLRDDESAGNKPKIYVELWLGRHVRAVGGLSYIRDIVEMAGGDLVYSDRAEGYFIPDFEDISLHSPDVFVCFHEPEFLVDGEQLASERGWAGVKVVMSTVLCGENMIQDGPSMLETSAWLRRQIKEVLG